MRSLRFSRSVPLLKSLHWLPVHCRIMFKICTVASQALSSTQQIEIHVRVIFKHACAVVFANKSSYK